MTEKVNEVSVHDSVGREYLADKTNELLSQIQTKYNEHGIDDKPSVYIKSDQGTYGMAIQVVHDATQVLSFNRKTKNKLNIGKGTTRYLTSSYKKGLLPIYP